MAKTGDLLDSNEGELREELKCEDCGQTSAIYHTRDGQELLEDGAYSDRNLEVDLGGSDKTIEWEGGLSHTSSTTTLYERQVRGSMTIDGPQGKLTIRMTFYAMLDDNDEIEPGKIVQSSLYYREGEIEVLTDSRAEWDVSVDVVESPQQFISEAKKAAEADPHGEYEEISDQL